MRVGQLQNLPWLRKTFSHGTHPANSVDCNGTTNDDLLQLLSNL